MFPAVTLNRARFIIGLALPLWRMFCIHSLV